MRELSRIQYLDNKVDYLKAKMQFEELHFLTFTFAN